jgi:hypothetical protein
MISLVQSALMDQLSVLSRCGLIGEIPFMPTAFGVPLPITGAGDTIVIDGDAAALAFYLNGSVFQPAGTEIDEPDILLQIQDAGSGRYLSREPMHWMTVVGTALRPFIFPSPWLTMPNSNIAITLTNLSGAQYGRVDLTLVCSKIFGRRGFNLGEIGQPTEEILARYQVPAEFAYQR